MRGTDPPSPAVVVGIDGSRSSVRAALWAIDEAVDRDIPLRLVCAIEPDGMPEDLRRSACAEAKAGVAVQQVVAEIEATDKPVKIEVDRCRGRAATQLQEASRGAALLCVGATGNEHPATRPLGSTAAALVTRADCPVAVIQGLDAVPATTSSVVVDVDCCSPDDVVLQRGIDEAVLRDAPLVVASAWSPHFTDIHDSRAVAKQNRLVRARLNRYLAAERQRHPALDIQTVAVHGRLQNYLARHAQSTQLVVVGSNRAGDVVDMIGSLRHGAQQDKGCSVMVCHRPTTICGDGVPPSTADPSPVASPAGG